MTTPTPDDYLNLIRQLLDCPSGQESKIMEAYDHLLDKQFVQIALAVAAQAQEQGETNVAQFLIRLAGHVAQVIDPETEVIDQERFMFRLLHTIRNSQGSPEQEVYPVLQDNLHHLNNDLLDLLPQFFHELIQGEPTEQQQRIAADFANFGFLILDFPLGNQALNIDLSIAGYSLSLEILDRHSHRESWAGIQMNRAAAYANRTRGDQASNIEEAIAGYNLALEIYTRKKFPMPWAATQMNRANAYKNRIQGNRNNNLEEAIKGYEAALTVYTRTSFPIEWAGVQNNRANAYTQWLQIDRADNIEKAIKGYEAALEVHTRAGFPKEWAAAQNNRANAYWERIRGDRADNIEQAIKGYEAALEVRTRTDFPIDWAQTQENLANAYSDRIRGDRADNIEQAIKGYEAALEVRTRTDFPAGWAQIQDNLASAYSDWIRGDRADNIEQAIKGYKAALEVYTKSSFPAAWARVKTNLASTYFDRIRGDRADNLEQAIKGYDAALEVYTQIDFPIDWATIQMNLASTYLARIRGNRADNIEQAIKGYEAALKILTPQAIPLKALLTGQNLGNAAFTQADWPRAIRGFGIAIAAVEESRRWANTEERRQEIMRESIGVYEKMVQACINAGDITQALETVERSRSKRLVDLMASRDLYSDGEIPAEVQIYLDQYNALQAEINQLRLAWEQQQSANRNSASDGKTDEPRELMLTRRRAAIDALTPQIAAKEAEKQIVWQKLCQLDPVLGSGKQIAPLDLANLRHLLTTPTTALVSFYTTDTDTHVFILRPDQPQPQHHICTGQGLKNLQNWLFDTWVEPYLTDRAAWTAAMPTTLAELAQRLQVEQWVPQYLNGITDVILIPHLYLHQIPFAALPLGNDAEHPYFGDHFQLRTVASGQVLKFCADRPPVITLNRYGSAEDATNDLPYATLEGDLLANLLQQSAPSAIHQRLIGQQQATTTNYKQLLTTSHLIHSAHHAQSRLDDPLQSALRLGDGDLTVGQLLSPSYRFPDLAEVILACCETNLGLTQITDDILTLAAGFLCAGARTVISSLWAVNDQATALFSWLYHQHRLAGKNRAAAVQQAQRDLRNLNPGHPTLEQLLDELNSLRKQARRQRDAQPADSQAYKQWAQRYDFYCNLENELSNINQAKSTEEPFAHPKFWAAFTCNGLA